MFFFSVPLLKKGYITVSFRSLNPRKAIGVDNLSARIFKIAAPVIAPSITNSMNYSIEHSVFPNQWKIA